VKSINASVLVFRSSLQAKLPKFHQVTVKVHQKTTLNCKFLVKFRQQPMAMTVIYNSRLFSDKFLQLFVFQPTSLFKDKFHQDYSTTEAKK